MPATRPAMRPRAAALAILAIVVCGGALRFGVAAATFPSEPTGDEIYYLSTARNIAGGRGHRDAYGARAAWPPGQAYFLSWFARAKLPRSDENFERRLARFDPNDPDPPLTALLRAPIAAQAALGTLLVALTGALGWVLFDARAAVVASALAALYPSFIAQSHYLWSEGLFAVLLMSALIGVVASAERPHWIATLACGVLFGLATLTREIALVCALCCAFWWGWMAPGPSRRRALGHSALLVVLAVVVIAPWSVRNYQLFGRVVPVATVGWQGIREGNTLAPWSEVRAFRKRYFSIGNEMERLDFARSEALALIRAEQPLWVFRKLARNVPELFSPHTIGLYKIQRHTYRETLAPWARAYIAASVVTYLLVVVATVVGVVTARRRGRVLLALLMLGALLAVHVATNAHSKYRFPFMPLAIAYAGAALSLGPTLRQRLRGPRLWAALAVLIGFAATSLPHFAQQIGPIWASTGTPADSRREGG